MKTKIEVEIPKGNFCAHRFWQLHENCRYWEWRLGHCKLFDQPIYFNGEAAEKCGSCPMGEVDTTEEDVIEAHKLPEQDMVTIPLEEYQKMKKAFDAAEKRRIYNRDWMKKDRKKL